MIQRPLSVKHGGLLQCLRIAETLDAYGVQQGTVMEFGPCRLQPKAINSP